MVLKKIITVLIAVLFPITAMSEMQDTLTAQKTSPVSVVFGVRSLAPETPVNTQAGFVSQEVSLPAVTCGGCAGSSTRWESAWMTAGMTYLMDPSQKEKGWYVFDSGLKGIGIGVKTLSGSAGKRLASGAGNTPDLPGELTVGLVRLSRDTGAGLADLPPAQFRRLTTFYDTDGKVVYAQEDTIRVSADLTVPTCTSTAGSLSFQMPDIPQVWLRRNVQPGHYTDTLMSPSQLVVANCSENTQNLRIRFIPAGSVSDSVLGPDTILVGNDAATGQATGTGYLMKYDAQGFGQRMQGVVQWNRQWPLILVNPAGAQAKGGELTQAVTVSLQAFYARPQNGKDVSAGQIVAKGMYQVSYD
ncbi:hypothetical protein J1780_04635 [Rahnella aceris]|uniref:hypothetical protein n=1 Tax=Rahnella sp. (strain Y9602) TaxID=2703885 RepID=UPI001C27DD0B|nr:hypothetical protein [Rahnella aceris]MBU9839244.1 hypothetical protein [Rahnella aceris]